MENEQSPDVIDTILEQWRRERPDLDTRPMEPLGRLKRCAAQVQIKLNKVFLNFGLTSWEFDVLAALRRSGVPYCLAPTALFSTLMVTSGTMTHRMRRLEQSGLVERMPNPDDARSMLVRLTPTGLELIDRAVTAYVANEQTILAAIKPDSMDMLNICLTELLAVLEDRPTADWRRTLCGKSFTLPSQEIEQSQGITNFTETSAFLMPASTAFPH